VAKGNDCHFVTFIARDHRPHQANPVAKGNDCHFVTFTVRDPCQHQAQAQTKGKDSVATAASPVRATL
jgi:hypothetical protein